MREVPTIDDRYIAWTDLNPDADPTAGDPWAKVLTGFDPESKHGWQGPWADTMTFDDEPHIHLQNHVGQLVLVSNPTADDDIPDDEDPPAHKVVRVADIDDETGDATIMEVPKPEAIDAVTDNPLHKARYVAHRAVGAQDDLRTLGAIIAALDGDTGFKTPTDDAIEDALATILDGYQATIEEALNQA